LQDLFFGSFVASGARLAETNPGYLRGTWRTRLSDGRRRLVLGNRGSSSRDAILRPGLHATPSMPPDLLEPR
jgi:hypothetical protein